MPVIVFLKNQPAAGGGARDRSDQRFALIQAAQAPYLDQLEQLGAADVHRYGLVDAIAARVPSSAVAALTDSPGVAAVIPDSPIVGPAAAADAPAAASPSRRRAAPGTAASTVKAPPGTCSATTPQLAPDALPLTHTDSTAAGAVTARSLGYTGAGVKVAFLADGIDPGNVNLQRGGKSVISRYADFTGDGTAAPTEGGEAFIDANAIAGQGRQVYNVAGFGAQSPGTACNIRIEGVAPGASLVALKVFSNNDISTTSGVPAGDRLRGRHRARERAQRVVRLQPVPRRVLAGRGRGVQQHGGGGRRHRRRRGGRRRAVQHDRLPRLRPERHLGRRVDRLPVLRADRLRGGGQVRARRLAERQHQRALKRRVHPGRADPGPGGARRPVLRLLHARLAKYADCVNFLGQASPVEESGGTSESAPEVAGAAALVIQAYRKAHGGATPTPAIVKQILLSTATDLGAPATEQGSGLLNSLKAVELASYMPHCDPVGETLRLSSNQLNYVGKPGATAHWSVTVTNTGAKTQKVAVAGRGFTADSVVKQATVTLSDSRSAHFTSWTGTAANYATVRFTVPAGQALLNSSIAWPSTAASRQPPEQAGQARPGRPVRAAGGALAAAGRPTATAAPRCCTRRPGRGRRRSSATRPRRAARPAAVRFGASVARTSSFGSVSPSSVTLAPGASGTVRVSAVVPAGAGDSSGAIEFGTGPAGGGPVSVPVTLRGLVDAGLGTSGTFSGVLTGGNGRSPGEGQVESYSFVVPSNLPVMLRDLEANVVLGNDPENQVSAYLVAPGGQTMGYGSNYLTTGFTASGVPVESPRRQLSLYTSDPTAGVWRLIIDFTSPVPGNELTDPFTGLIRFNAVRWSRGKLPAGPRTTLKAGKSYSYQIRLDNTGAAPEDVFLDARRRGLATYTLAPQDAVRGSSCRWRPRPTRRSGSCRR